jgi:TonB family protein
MRVKRSLHSSRSRFILTAYALALLAAAVLLGPHRAPAQQTALHKLTLDQVQQLVSNRMPDATMRTEIKRRGLAFTPDSAIVESLRSKGAGPLTLEAIEELIPKKVMLPGDPSLPRTVESNSVDDRQAQSGGGLLATAHGNAPAMVSSPALDQARGEVHQLQRQVAEKRASALSIPPKDMFETTADYEKRKHAAEIAHEVQLLPLVGQIDSLRNAVYPDGNLKPLFVSYDADAKLLIVEIAGERFSFPLDNTDAKQMHDAWAGVAVGFEYFEAVEQPPCPVLLWQNRTFGATTGFGACSGGGRGSGASDGYRPDYGDSAARGLYRVGNGVTAPVALNNVEAVFTDQARKAKYQGVCIVSLIVDAQGKPQNPRVVRSLGMGLDEKALEAVLKYRFRPAMKGNTPVPVMISVEVNFRLY